jgi:hypothetical protein
MIHFCHDQKYIHTVHSTSQAIGYCSVIISVAEPAERQLFDGAGYVKCYKTPKFFILKFEDDIKNHNFVAFYFKEPFDEHFCL